VEALAPYATEDNARTAVLLMLGLPAAWVLCSALGALGRACTLLHLSPQPAPRGPGRKPGASSCTLTRLSLVHFSPQPEPISPLMPPNHAAYPTTVLTLRWKVESCKALALGLWPFAKKMRPVPKSVAKESVPLRTPTPETKSKPRTPFTAVGGRTPGSSGKEFTSPEGDKVRFA